MFTGLIERTGTIAELKPTATGLRLRVSTSLAAELTAGDSLAVNGVCLTVIAGSPDDVFFDVGPETARVTSLGSLKPGAVVNLERPLRADARLGGHFVQGHVDATGTLDDVRCARDRSPSTASASPSRDSASGSSTCRSFPTPGRTRTCAR
jgi:riboflavin synthase